MSAIFNDNIVVARGGTVSYGTTSGSWTSLATSQVQHIHMILISLTLMEQVKL
jgi:hypothetical protein